MCICMALGGDVRVSSCDVRMPCACACRVHYSNHYRVVHGFYPSGPALRESQLRWGPCGARKYDRSFIRGLRSAVVLRGAAATASKREKRKAVAKSEAIR